MATLSVAVVGSGPAGLYTAEALVKQAAALDPPCQVAVDVLDRLPTPYGLVRYGVAPDHPSIKSIAEYLRGVLEHDQVSFLGGVRLGGDVTREDLLGYYDAVVYATGAMRDRRMGIEGEDLPGSYAATDFVNWYCGHPDTDSGSFTLDAESVAVVGVGNVAVDVARILVRDPEELRRTDVSQPVLEALMASKVREVHVIGRRGPAQAKFTTKELRELGELAGVDIVVGAGEADPGAFDATGGSATLAESDRRVRGNLAVIGDWAARAPAGHARRLLVRFWLRPVRVEGTAHVTGLTVERTRIGESGTLTGTGDPGADGAAQRGIPERAAAGCAVRRAQPHGAERRGPGARARREPAAAGVCGRVAQARPHRGHRHQQVRRGADRPCPAGRPVPGRRAGRGPGGPRGAGGAAGRPRGGTGELRRLAQGGAGRGGTRRVAGPRGPCEAAQPCGDRRPLPRRIVLARGERPHRAVALSACAGNVRWPPVCGGTGRVSRK